MIDKNGNKETREIEEGSRDSEQDTQRIMGKSENVSTLKSPESPAAIKKPWIISEEEEGQGAWTDDIHRSMSVAFRQELLSILQVKTDSKVGLEVSRLSDPELDVIELFGRCLPDIASNVILAKREVCYLF